jgi:DNA-binding transcriptional LysR family regulator
MEVRQLRYFVALAEELNYGHAAVRLRISKPTLSQQIAVLERSLSTHLIDRGSRVVALTTAGEVLLAEARKVLAACERLTQAVATVSSSRAPVDVRVSNGLQHAVAGALREAQRDPELQVNLATTSSLDAEDAVVSGRADAAIVWLPSGTYTTLHALRIAATGVSLAVPAGHRLASMEPIPVSELADEVISLFPRRLAAALWDLFVGHLLPNGYSPEQILDEPTATAPMRGMVRAVSEGRAVAPFVHTSVDKLSMPGVVLRSLHPPLEVPIHLICREPGRADLRRLVTIMTSHIPDEDAPSEIDLATEWGAV